MILSSALFRGNVMHRRLRPRRHRLTYKLAMVLLDLDKLGALDRRLRLFSIDRFNLFSFRPCDHGDGSTVPLRRQIEQQLNAAGIPAKVIRNL